MIAFPNLQYCLELVTLITFIMTYFFVFLPQGGMTLTYDPTTALQNGSVLVV